MNPHLGFALAAHHQPDMLIIDEVLSVGDARFQQKAFGRIKEMAGAGAPVVLVSHQLDRISELCTKAILLERGAVRTTGSPLHCINAYLHGMSGRGQGSDGQGVEFQRILASDGQVVRSGEEMTITVAGSAAIDDAPKGWVPAIGVVDSRTGRSVHSISGLQRNIPLPVEGDFEYEIVLQMNVPPGTYHIIPSVWDSLTRQEITTGPHLQVEVMEQSPFYGDVQMNSRWRAIKSGARADVSPDSKRQTA